MQSMSMLKWFVVFGAPLSYFIIGVIHPAEIHVGDNADLYIGIHIVQLFSIWGMALMLQFMTAGLESGMARFARAAVLPYAIAYAAFDALVGLAMGLLVHKAAGMSAADQAAIERIIEAPGVDLIFLSLWIASGLTWLIAAGAAVLSLRGRAPAGALALLMTGAAIFAVAHVFPPGPVGMSLFLAGLAWLAWSTVPARRSGTTEGPVLVREAV